MTGLASLFVIAFLAATILPFSSELVLTGLAASQEYSTISLFFAASLGNILGALVNYGLGCLCLHWQGRRWFPVSEKDMEKAQSWFSRYGVWSLLLAWVPVIGDPITLVAGVMRVNLSLFLLLVTLSKAGRYAILLGILNAI